MKKVPCKKCGGKIKKYLNGGTSEFPNLNQNKYTSSASYAKNRFVNPFSDKDQIAHFKRYNPEYYFESPGPNNIKEPTSINRNFQFQQPELNNLPMISGTPPQELKKDGGQITPGGPVAEIEKNEIGIINAMMGGGKEGYMISDDLQHPYKKDKKGKPITLAQGLEKELKNLPGNQFKNDNVSADAITTATADAAKNKYEIWNETLRQAHEQQMENVREGIGPNSVRHGGQISKQIGENRFNMYDAPSHEEGGALISEDLHLIPQAMYGGKTIKKYNIGGGLTGQYLSNLASQQGIHDYPIENLNYYNNFRNWVKQKGDDILSDDFDISKNLQIYGEELNKIQGNKSNFDLGTIAGAQAKTNRANTLANIEPNPLPSFLFDKFKDFDSNLNLNTDSIDFSDYKGKVDSSEATDPTTNLTEAQKKELERIKKLEKARTAIGKTLTYAPELAAAAQYFKKAEYPTKEMQKMPGYMPSYIPDFNQGSLSAALESTKEASPALRNKLMQNYYDNFIKQYEDFQSKKYQTKAEELANYRQLRQQTLSANSLSSFENMKAKLEAEAQRRSNITQAARTISNLGKQELRETFVGKSNRQTLKLLNQKYADYDISITDDNLMEIMKTESRIAKECPTCTEEEVKKRVAGELG